MQASLQKLAVTTVMVFQVSLECVESELEVVALLNRGGKESGVL